MDGEVKPFVMDCHYITDVLRCQFGNAHYLVNNVYFFDGSYGETDLLVVQKSGLIFDIEVKISRSDFFADFKKEIKHKILSGIISQIYTPNKFYYAVPEGLVKESEIPSYAGLIYIKPNNTCNVVKAAPFLHKNKLEFRTKLSDKFYYSYIELNNYKKKDKVSEFKKEISELKRMLELARKDSRELYRENLQLKRHGNENNT